MTIKTLQNHIDIIMVQFSTHELAKNLSVLTQSSVLYGFSKLKDLTTNKYFTTGDAGNFFKNLLEMKKTLSNAFHTNENAKLFFETMLQTIQEAFLVFIKENEIYTGK